MGVRAYRHSTTGPRRGTGELIFVREDGIVAYPGRELEVAQFADVILFSNLQKPLDGIIKFWTKFDIRKDKKPTEQFGHCEVIIDPDPIGDPTDISAEVFGLVPRLASRLLMPGTRGEIWRHDLAAMALTREFVLRQAVRRAAQHPRGYDFAGAARSSGPIDRLINHLPIAARIAQESLEKIFCSLDTLEESRDWGAVFDILPGIDISKNIPSPTEIAQGLRNHPQWKRVAYWLPREV